MGLRHSQLVRTSTSSSSFTVNQSGSKEGESGDDAFYVLLADIQEERDLAEKQVEMGSVEQGIEILNNCRKRYDQLKFKKTSEMLAKDSRIISCCLQLAMLYCRCERYRDALQVVNEALSIDTENHLVYLCRAKIYLADKGQQQQQQQRHHHAAVSDLERAVTLQPSNDEAKFLLMSLNSSKGTPIVFLQPRPTLKRYDYGSDLWQQYRNQRLQHQQAAIVRSKTVKATDNDALYDNLATLAVGQHLTHPTALSSVVQMYSAIWSRS